METETKKSDKIIGYGLVALIILAMLFASYVTLKYNAPKPRAYKIECMNNLKQVGIALALYYHENEKAFPQLDDQEGLNMVLPLLAGHKELLSCPKTKLGYKYKGGLTFDIENPDSVPMAWEEGFPYNNTKAVLFMDGHVETFTKEEWDIVKQFPIVKIKPKEKAK